MTINTNFKTVITSINQALPLLNANNIDLVTFDLQAFYDTGLSQMYFDLMLDYLKENLPNELRYL